MDESQERGMTIEEGLIQACKEVNLMRKGLMPKRGWRDLWEELEKELAEEEALEKQNKKVRAFAK